MNPFDLSASDLLIWGIVLHLVADWPFQNDWMSTNKGNLLHPAGYVHASIHGGFLALVFGWVAIPLAIAHLLIDTRKPVEWWSKLVGQTQPTGLAIPTRDLRIPVVDIGLWVRLMLDQVFHIVCVAVAALVVAT